MHLLQFTIVKLSFFLLLGILTGYLLHIPLELSILIGVLLLLLLALELRLRQKTNTLRFGLLTALTTIAVGVLSISLTRPTNKPDHYSHFLNHKTQLHFLKIQEVLKSSDFSDRYTAQVLRIDSLPVSGKILLNIERDSIRSPLVIDDEIWTYTTLAPISPPLNPYQFNYKKYLSDQGIGHEARIISGNYVLKDIPRTTIFGVAAKLRVHIIKKLKQEAFGEAELGIIQALLLGQRNDLTEATNTDYKNAGAFHILALSGLHIGIILGLLHILLRPLEWLPKGKLIKLISIILLLWSFALLAGLSASILRAVGMFTFVAYALHLNRPTNHFNILALSFFFILLIFDPRLLFHVGFQLSYAAVFAIVLIYPHLKKLWVPKNWILKKGWEVIAVSMAAQLGVLPITLFYFHQFPGLFLLSSLLILPPLGFILGMGILIISLALINKLPSFLVVAYDTIIRWMNATIAWVAQQENFLFRNISFDFVQLLLTCGILISAVSILVKGSYKRIVCLFACIVGLQLWQLGLNYRLNQKESLFIGHISRNSALVHQLGARITVYTNKYSTTERLVSDYATAMNIRNLKNKSLQNSYILGQERVIVLDNSIRSLPFTSKSFTLLLTQSPRINLERLLDSVSPKTIIADGSNYRSYIERWKSTCVKKNIPFHYTGEKGAYIFKLP